MKSVKGLMRLNLRFEVTIATGNNVSAGGRRRVWGETVIEDHADPSLEGMREIDALYFGCCYWLGSIAILSVCAEVLRLGFTNQVCRSCRTNQLKK